MPEIVFQTVKIGIISQQIGIFVPKLFLKFAIFEAVRSVRRAFRRISHYMKRLMKMAVSACILVISAVSASAGTAQSDTVSAGVRFAYDVDFEMNFDNREFDYSHIFPSYTIFGARLTPAVGVSFTQKNGARHRVMIGIDVMKDFGRSPVRASTASTATTASTASDGVPVDPSEYSDNRRNLDLFDEITIYYMFERRLGRTDFSLTAGIFPRRFAEGEYSTAFFSDSLRWYDNNLEGLLLKFRRPRSSFEVGCDWMGMAGVDSRERFMIFSAGKGSVSETVTLGYAAYMYHFAGSANAPGVVDNILVNPYVDFDFTGRTPLQRLHLSVGWLQSLQNDRELVHRYVAPGGAELIAGIRNWNVGIENRLFFGGNMMPYYNTIGTGGEKYDNMLYMGDPFYRVRDMEGWHLYDRLEVFYAPRISRFLDLKVAAVLHFSGVYAGWQQMVTLHFNLQELLGRIGEN